MAVNFGALAAKAQGALPSAVPAALDPNRELHIDGDYAAYYYSGKDDTAPGAAKANMLDAFRNVRQLGGAGGRAVVHLSAGGGDKGKRYKIATVKNYQGQRDSGRKPKNWEYLRDFLENSLPHPEFKGVLWSDREADDGVAAAAAYAHTVGRTPVIYSRDKDFRMIPGLHIVWTTLDAVRLHPGEWERIGPDGEVYGLKWFYLQMLQGDTADNIPGLERIRVGGKDKTIGAVGADKLLAGTANIMSGYNRVAEAYEGYYGEAWTDRFVEQAALLWMRTDNQAAVEDFLKAVPPEDHEELAPAIQRMKERL